MSDQITNIGKSLIQHGKHSDRVYLMKLHPNDAGTIIPKLIYLAKMHQYSKIFCKVPEGLETFFMEKDFIREAQIPGFYKGRKKVYFYSLFLDPARKQLKEMTKREIRQNIKIANEYSRNPPNLKLDHSVVHTLNIREIPRLKKLYQQVFPSYPFPITNPDYLKETMKSHVDYFGVYKDEKLVAAASSEKDVDSQNAEMTDFATLPKFRGKGCSGTLLKFMESRMKMQNMKTLYTIARAHSPGMNITFARLKYKFAGTLVKNTQISGRIESMNVWYKHLGSC